MTKAEEIAKVSVRGSFHLLWGLVISTVISAVGTIYLASILSSDQMGLYTLAFTAPNIIGAFRDFGVNSALIRYIAQYNSEKRSIRAKKIILSGLFFEVVSGIVLTMISLLLSTPFADLYHLASIAPLIQVVSFTILISAFLTVAQSAFTGFEQMKLSSITLIIQSTTRTFLSPALVVIGLGVFGATLGYTIALLIAAVSGMLLMWLLYRNLSSPGDQIRTEKTGMVDDAKTLLKYGFPLSIAGIVSMFQTQFYIMVMGVYSTAEVVGNYTIATAFVGLIAFFASPISTMLFPAFSKLDPQKDPESSKSVYQFSVKYAALLVVPAATIVMTLSQPGISTLFGNKYSLAPLFLTLLSITYLYTATGNLTAGNFINGQGKTVFNLKLSLLSAAIGFPLSIILTVQLGIMGIIITTLVAGLPSLFISLIWIKKNYNLDIDWASSARILLCSALSGTLTYVIQTQITFSNLINLIIGAVTFLVILLTSTVLTHTVNLADIENLRQMTTSLGPVYRLLNLVLSLIEKLLVLTKT
jgi:O-antigen/teichoic acid export membrane protein